MLGIFLKRSRYITAFVLLILLFALAGCNTKTSQKELEKIAEEQDQSNNEVAEVTFQCPKEALIVCLESTNEIAIVDLAKEEVAAKIPVGVAPIDILKSSDNKRVFVANSQSGDITVVGLDNGESYTIPMGSSPTKMELAPDGNTLYVVDYLLNGVRVVDTDLLSLVKVLGLNNAGYEQREVPLDCCLDPFNYPVAIGRGPAALALNPAGELLYVGNLATRDIAIVNLEEEWETSTWDGVVGVRDMLIAGSPPKLFLAAIGSSDILMDEIYVVDLETGQINQKIKVGQEPIALELDPDGKILYALAREEQKLVAIDVERGSISATCEVGQGARDLTLANDGSKIFVSHEMDGTVSVIDTDRFEMVTTVPVGVKPSGLVYVTP